MSTTNLTGHLLIAMPALADPNFHRTVTFICEHADEGALGLIVNRPIDLTLGEVLTQFDCRTDDPAIAGQSVFLGGPVQTERGFVLHRGGKWESSAVISGDISITTSRDILGAIAAGAGPADILVALGYAGWGSGQLEQEMAQNSWLSAPVDPAILFATPVERRWEAAAELIGVNLKLISGEAGHS